MIRNSVQVTKTDTRCLLAWPVTLMERLSAAAVSRNPTAIRLPVNEWGGRCVNALTDSTVLVHLKPFNPLTEAGQIRRLLFVTKWWLCVKLSAAQTESTSECSV